MGSWNSTGSVRGPEGPAGPQGSPGVQGIQGPAGIGINFKGQGGNYTDSNPALTSVLAFRANGAETLLHFISGLPLGPPPQGIQLITSTADFNQPTCSRASLKRWAYCSSIAS
jgi:hypothetical protein